ncbi:MAG: hypothetical protein KAS17_04910 [Victivallaceae bacterium]|nr:hypothetical protein [Victivallaceae bacterium]
MTIGEKNIFAAVLNFLRNNDLISKEALDEAFEKLRLPQEYKEICEDNVIDFTGGTQYMQQEFAELNKLQDS